MQFAVTAGQTYYVQVGGYRADDGAVAGGALTLNLAADAIVAPNDAFAAALVAGPPPFTRASLDTRQAGSEAGEPAPGCAPVARTVWFRYTAPADATLVADTIGSDFDTVLAAYRGTALGALTQVGCADDIDFQSGNVRSRLQFGVTAGQTYYVQLGSFAGAANPAGGIATFNLTALPVPPANDVFAAALDASAAAVRPHGDRHPRRRRRRDRRADADVRAARRERVAAAHPDGQRRARRGHDR